MSFEDEPARVDVPVVREGTTIVLDHELRLNFAAIEKPHPGGGNPAVVTVVCLLDGVPIGHLKWTPHDDGELTHVFVDDHVRRRRIATTLWEVAHEVAVLNGWTPPQHSGHRSLEGYLWARAVGGDLPEPKEPLRPWDEWGQS